VSTTFHADRIGAADYRPLRNRHVVIVKMLNSQLNG
jgi:hypothetical protein